MKDRMMAMILAAGRGERMRPLTDETPKPLLEVRGKPLIQWQIENLRDAGFESIVVNVSWLKEQLIDFLGDGARFGIEIRISEEPPGALETAGGIHQALPLLGERFLVVNGDVLTDFPFATLRRQPQGNDLAHLVMIPNPAHNPDGDFSLHDGRLSGNGTSKLTFSGIGVYRAEMFAGIPEGAAPLAPLFREAMQANRVSGELYAGRWVDVGTPERLAELHSE